MLVPLDLQYRLYICQFIWCMRLVSVMAKYKCVANLEMSFWEDLPFLGQWLQWNQLDWVDAVFCNIAFFAEYEYIYRIQEFASPARGGSSIKLCVLATFTSYGMNRCFWSILNKVDDDCRSHVSTNGRPMLGAKRIISSRRFLHKSAPRLQNVLQHDVEIPASLKDALCEHF